MNAREYLTILSESLALDGIDSRIFEGKNPVLVMLPDAVGPLGREVQMEISILSPADDMLQLQILSIIAENTGTEQADSFASALNRMNLSALCGGYILLPDGALAHRHVFAAPPDRWLEMTSSALQTVLYTLDADIEKIFELI